VKIKVYPARRNNTKMWRNGLADLGAGQWHVLRKCRFRVYR
jgi:hypothetical protein